MEWKRERAVSSLIRNINLSPLHFLSLSCTVSLFHCFTVSLFHCFTHKTLASKDQITCSLHFPGFLHKQIVCKIIITIIQLNCQVQKAYLTPLIKTQMHFPLYFVQTIWQNCHSQQLFKFLILYFICLSLWKPFGKHGIVNMLWNSFVSIIF